MIDYKVSNNKDYRYIFVIFDNFSRYVWAIPLKNKYSKTITNKFSIILTTSKRKPIKLESDRGKEWYIHHYSRFTDKRPSIAERVFRTIRNMLKKPIFLKGNAVWLSEHQSVVKKYNNAIHHSSKIPPNQAFKKSNEKQVYSNLRDDREIQTPKYKLGQLVRTADIKSVFSKGDSTNYSYKLYTITEVIDGTIPSYRINYLHERYNENLLLPAKLSLDENNQVMKELNLIQ